MKTTENISLAGYAFTIETEAYEELGAYLSDIRTCFSSDASADEIVADIEERIAELLRERCIVGMVVDLPMVLDIKKRIGDPKELASEDTEASFETKDEAQEQSQQEQPKQEKKADRKNRRIYRNMDERVLGGVCSGLGTYFGLDKVLFRIIFLVIFFISIFGSGDGPVLLFPILAYICLWIAMPAARTAEQKREMKGQPMDLNSYKDKDFDFGKEVKEVVKSPAGQTFERVGGVFLGILLLLAGFGGLVGCAFIRVLPEIFSHEVADHINRWGSLDAEEMIVEQLLTGTTFWGMVMVIVGILCIWFIYNGVMLLFNLKAPSWKPGLVIFIAWIISIFVLAGWVALTVSDMLPMLIIL
jgi:phage shock protein PspC (stress-responsive transcriptional regulator)